MSLDVSKIPEDILQELLENFKNIDENGSGYLEEHEVREALNIAGFKLAPYQVIDLMRKHDTKVRDGKLDFNEFKGLYAELRNAEFGHTALKSVKPVQHNLTTGSSSQFANPEIKHSIRTEEQVAFSGWINKNLTNDSVCQRYLPFHPEGQDMYDKCRDGIILCKIINKSVPDTIDERAINAGTKLSVYKMNENVTLALNSAQAIGCNVVNIGGRDISGGESKHLLLGLLWQIIKAGLLSEINLASCAELAILLKEGETLADLRKLSPEAILLRWVNYHLQNAGCNRTIHNFGDDIKDSEIYAYLLQQITPRDKQNGMNSVRTVLSNDNNLQRAHLVLDNADNLDARVFVNPGDIAGGNAKLNLAFVANLFNEYPALERKEGDSLLPEEEEDFVEETREERTYRNWMNSMGVSPSVNYLYSDLRDGLVIFQLYDIIKPGIVDWKRVLKKFSKFKINFEILENCNYAVELGKVCHFSLVGIGGEDLRDCNVTLTLALVWQLMRAYTLAMLTRLTSSGKPIQEREIIDWANTKLAGTSSLRSFQDHSLSNGRIILDLVQKIRSGSVNPDLVRSGNSEEDCLANAKYAISMSRKIGAKLYALPEDITEVKSKMVMTVFACLMLVDLDPGKK